MKASAAPAHPGIVVGQWRGRYLRFCTQQFVLLAAPTRSGKGVGIVIPNLLSYEHSAVVLDVKQENYDITAGFRKEHGQEVYLFNPFAEDFRTARYNPLSAIDRRPQDRHPSKHGEPVNLEHEKVFRVGDILAIGYALYPTGGHDSFWNDSARNLFLGLTLMLFELRDARLDPKHAELDIPVLPITIGEVLRQSSGKGQPVKQYIGTMVAKYGAALSGRCIDALNRFLANDDKVLASILATFNAPLTIWANPIVDAATSENDFDLRDVRRKKMTVYLGVTPDHLDDAKVLLNLMFSQLVNLNTKELPQDNPDLKYQCLLLMDEFTAIGKVGIIAKAISYMAGYNMRLLAIIQSMSQLESVYGKEDARTFATNCAMQLLYPPREQKDANEYSEMLGYLTEKSTSVSRSRGWSSRGGGPSESISDQRRALMLPQELRELGQGKEIIMLENTKPILADKIIYWKDPVFKSRLMQAPEVKLLDVMGYQARVEHRVRDVLSTELDAQGRLTIPVDQLEILADMGACDLPDLHEDLDDNGAAAYVEHYFTLIGVPQAPLRNALQEIDAQLMSVEVSIEGTLPESSAAHEVMNDAAFFGGEIEEDDTPVLQMPTSLGADDDLDDRDVSNMSGVTGFATTDDDDADDFVPTMPASPAPKRGTRSKASGASKSKRPKKSGMTATGA
ncbi:type IV secretion system protein VirD4 [Burkholderia ubonensis]|uniref:type IV secretory system conjugative DNA transfer family protein n=1 Tax=Burkholderia ubonensis TaxID=101571 RepID=UPI000751DA86|nr:type IV secretory system conjugative DNA transfer family protein [Burkholderia ubonensis]KVU84292.1 type IV secretion system protein VirD4 [Burkholderia ubonensis]